MQSFWKRYDWISLSFSIVFFMISCSPLRAQNDRTYTIGWEAWEPFQFKDDKGNLTGLDVELMNAIMSAGNIKTKFVEIPWKRHLRELKDGKVDIAMAAAKIPEREVYAYFSDPYRTGGAVLFIRKSEREKWKFSSLMDLANTSFRLCVTRGYDYGDEYEKLKKVENYKGNIGEVTNETQCYLMLKKGNIDGFLADSVSATTSLRKENMLDMVEIILSVVEDNSFMMFSKKTVSKDFIKRFNENLESIRRNGLYYRIMSKYLSEKEDFGIESDGVEEDRDGLNQVTVQNQKKRPDLLKVFNEININQNLHMGRVSKDIWRFQTVMKALGFYKGDVNGFFSIDFATAVRDFQKKHDLMQDGIVGPFTYKAVSSYLE